MPGIPLHARGKVRDVYSAGECLVIVATDRLSAFDCILPTPIPGKGRVLTQMTLFWLELLRDIVPNHLVTADVSGYPAEFAPYREQLEGRSMLVRRLRMVDGGRLPEPIFTPARKAKSGHDENVSAEEVASEIGEELTGKLRELTLKIYRRAAEYAEGRGIILADTKFEFGFLGDELYLGDEVLTPDSSRFWPRATYRPGRAQESYDKQFVRDWLERSGWNKQPPAPELPEEIVRKTSGKYQEALAALAGGRS